MKKYLSFVLVLLSLFVVNKANASVLPTDTTPPVSTVTAGSYVFDTWTGDNVDVFFSCIDNVGGSGCKITQVPDNTYPYHCIDTTNTCTPDTATADLLITGEGTWYVRYFSEDVDGNTEATQAYVVKIDKTFPEYVKQISANIVEVLFSEDLQNNPSHHPQVIDFFAYNDLDNTGNYSSEGDSYYGISSVSYDNKKITITLINSIVSGDNPRLQMSPEGVPLAPPASLIDLAGNYLNGGEILDKPIELLPPPPPPPQGSGGLLEYIPPAQTPPPTGGNGNDQTPPAVVGGSGGQVLGAQTYQFTRTLRLGMKGDDVLELHKKLAELGLYKGSMDDYFGPLLELSVKVFQMINPPLVVDGIVGPKTMAVLNK
jgi:hypothetical protein